MIAIFALIVACVIFILLILFGTSGSGTVSSMPIVVLVIIIGLVIIAFVKKKHDKARVNNAVNLIQNYYRIVRDNLNDLTDSSVISVSTYWFERDGIIDSYSAFISVCVRKGSNDVCAHSLGMDIQNINGENYYQIVIREHFSRSQKRQIVKVLEETLSTQYTNDEFRTDLSLPALFSMVNYRVGTENVNSL